ncbi:MAG: HRDC domain-containing protein, partial [Bacillota bacterium]|nr:HRDC domain-containing protein [Bacillota bacterium]
TLMDMCIKMPTNEIEFLEVSGVGKMKLEAYGKEFLEVINSSGNIEISETIEPVFDLSEACKYIKETVELYDEPVPISIFTDRINVLLLQKGFKNISAKKVADYLVLEGFLQVETIDGKNSRVASEKGSETGITTILKMRQDNESYKQNFYDRTAQKLLVENIGDILKFAFND